MPSDQRRAGAGLPSRPVSTALLLTVDDRPGDAETGLSSPKEQILIVDDEALMREMVADVLTDLGYSVVSCGGGADGVECFRRAWKDIGLVILDMNMPDVNGREALIAMQAIDPDVRVLISTGMNATPAIRELEELGAVGVLHKPFRSDALGRVVQGILPG